MSGSTAAISCFVGIFDELRPGEDLVDGAFARLAAAGRLTTVQYPGFWAPVDTLRDVQRMQSLVESDAAPWMVWAVPPPPTRVVELDRAQGVTDEPALARDDAPARARDEAPADVTALDIASMGSSIDRCARVECHPGFARAAPPRVVAIRAHPDDIEIGCAGTITRLRAERADVQVTWVVLSGTRSDRLRRARAR